MSAVEAYAVGIVCASVCAPRDLPIEQVEDDVNRQHPTGISSRWKLSEDDHFATGQTNPCPCEKDPERQHWLLNC